VSLTLKSKLVTLTGAESRIVVVEDGERNEEVLVQAYKVPAMQDEQVLRLGGCSMGTS
jgi:hypothetical protein